MVKVELLKLKSHDDLTPKITEKKVKSKRDRS